MHQASTSQGGILHPQAAREHFTLSRHAPAGDLERLVERHWIVRWDLRGRASHTQETLPHPCVNLAITAWGSAIHGCETRRSGVQLEGQGRVFGTKFRPGAFFPLLGQPVSQLTDRSVPLGELFGAEADALTAAVLAADDDASQIALVEAFLRRRLPARDPGVERVIEIVQLALDRPEITRVEDLSELAQVPPRTLQRIFRRYVGVGPKWVIRCFRLHEAASRLAHSRDLDGASLAAELGYFDQAHFIRDFKQVIGHAPSEYAARCAAAARPM